jgi:quercetin dioxygenase-like cupin family protein
MAKQAMAVHSGEAKALNVMGGQVRFLCESGDTGNAWSIMECSLPKDSGPPPHDHPWDEAYYILEGELRFVIDGKAQTYRAGDFVYAPAGTLHGFQGVSEKPARVLILDVPAHTEGFFKDCDREVKSLPADLKKVPEIGLRHRIRFAVAS